jgi:hypothetical protein
MEKVGTSINVRIDLLHGTHDGRARAAKALLSDIAVKSGLMPEQCIQCRKPLLGQLKVEAVHSLLKSA